MKNQLTKLYSAVSAPVAATRDAFAETLQSVRETTSLLDNRMMENMGYGQQERLKDIVEKDAEEEEQQQEEDIDLTPREHDRALRTAYRSFVMPGKPKTDIDSYSDQAKLYIKTLIENQLKKMGSAKIIMTLYVSWKKLKEQPLIELHPEDVKNAKELDDGNTGDNHIRVEMPFNSLMTEFFEGSDISHLIQSMLEHIEAQTENPKFPESGFTLDKIMHLFTNFHRLVLTRGSSYTELPEWIQNKKWVINPRNKEEECFKWAVIVALHHEEIKKIINAYGG